MQLGDWLDACCLELARGALAHDYSVTWAQGAGGQSGLAGEGEESAAGSLRAGVEAPPGEGRHQGLPAAAAVMSVTDAAQAQASASFVQQLRLYRANVKVRLCVGRWKCTGEKLRGSWAGSVAKATLVGKLGQRHDGA